MKFILLISLFLSSCEVLKTRKASSSLVIAAAKKDTANLSKKDSGSTLFTNWYKETVSFVPVPGRDTTVNNFISTTPVSNYYPSQIIREGGSMTKADWLKLYDSVNAKKADTAATQISKVETKTKVKVLSAMQIIALCGLAYIVLAIIGKINFRTLFNKKP